MIIAFDPGETTGWASAFEHHWPNLSFETGTIRGIDELIRTFHAKALGHGRTTVIIERWHLFPGSALQKVGSEFPEIQVLGQIKMLCHMKELGWKIQEPSDQAAAKWPEAKLNKYGFKSRGKTTHERSAVCHILYYLLKLNNSGLIKK